jgi:hypothetical protein
MTIVFCLKSIKIIFFFFSDILRTYLVVYRLVGIGPVCNGEWWPLENVDFRSSQAQKPEHGNILGGFDRQLTISDKSIIGL